MLSPLSNNSGGISAFLSRIWVKTWEKPERFEIKCLLVFLMEEKIESVGWHLMFKSFLNLYEEQYCNLVH